MGMNTQHLRLLFVAKQLGVKFEKTITLGRQDLLIRPKQLKDTFSLFECPIEDREITEIVEGYNHFSEGLLKKLGSATVDSIDASSFEGATIIHDLNKPLSTKLAESFDLVIDGGTLEHVFDLPSAFRSVLSLPKIGGHFIMASPANNEMGHGFYQFSPELFYRVLSPENGYNLKCLFLAPSYDSEGQWYKVADPAMVHKRVGHNTALNQLTLFAIAERIDIKPFFTSPPQQSDYVAEWRDKSYKGLNTNRLSFFYNTGTENRDSSTKKIKALLRSIIPKHWTNFIRCLKMSLKASKAPHSSAFEAFNFTRKELDELSSK